MLCVQPTAAHAALYGHPSVEDLPHDYIDGCLLRPGVVWFGENLDEDVTERVDDVLESCDLLILIGTSAVVMPAAGYAGQVVRR